MNQFNTKYYLVLELPFDKVLVYKKAFSRLEDAEEIITNTLPWFSVWDHSRYSESTSKKIFIPIKKLEENSNIYQITVNFTADVQAKDPYTAHRTVRSLLKRSFRSPAITTYIDKTEELLQ